MNYHSVRFRKLTFRALVLRQSELIELLEERPCLWDVLCKEYHVREKRERAYEKIENELEIDLNNIKTKIVALSSA